MDIMDGVHVPVEVLEEIGKQLRLLGNMQPKRDYNNFDIVAAYFDEIENLLNKRHTIDEIVERFAAANITIKASTLRSYLSRLRASIDGGVHRKRRSKSRGHSRSTLKSRQSVEQKAVGSRQPVNQNMDTPVTSSGTVNTERNYTTPPPNVAPNSRESGAVANAIAKMKEPEEVRLMQPRRGAFEVRPDTPNI